MNVSFTGTQHGMTNEQRREVAFQLRLHSVRSYGTPNIFHFGWCIGADDEAAMIASNLGYTLVAYPGASTPDKRGPIVPHIRMAAEENLKRNRRIVDAGDVLIAAPRQRREVRRSGTWATIRYATKSSKPIVLIFPDGEVIRRDGR